MMQRLIPRIFYDSLREGLDLFVEGLSFTVAYQDEDLAVVVRDNAKAYLVASPEFAPNSGNSSLAACESTILSAINSKFKTDFSSTNVTDRFRYSKGAPVGQGTLNLNLTVPAAMQPTKVKVGRYPVNPVTIIRGAGATLHIPGGPEGADSPSTLRFTADQFTAHLDSALPYNPIGLLSHLINDMTAAGGYKPCP